MVDVCMALIAVATHDWDVSSCWKALRSGLELRGKGRNGKKEKMVRCPEAPDESLVGRIAQSCIVTQRNRVLTLSPYTSPSRPSLKRSPVFDWMLRWWNVRPINSPPTPSPKRKGGIEGWRRRTVLLTPLSRRARRFALPHLNEVSLKAMNGLSQEAGILWFYSVLHGEGWEGY